MFSENSFGRRALARGGPGRPVLLGITYILAVSSNLPAQTRNAPVVVSEKNVAELQKIRSVLVINGADGQHPAPEVDSPASAEFTVAISKQLDQLTCWKLVPRTSPTNRKAGAPSTTLMTYVEDTAIPNRARRTVTYGAVFQFSVMSNDGTLWDGSKRVGGPLGKQGFYTPAQIQGVVADMLNALARDACPGPLMSGAGPGAEPPTASFDCSKAVSRTEKLICSSAFLSNADAVM